MKALPIEPNLFPCKLSESHTNKNFLLQFFLSIYIPIKLKSIRASCLFKLFTFSLTFFVPSHFTLFKSQKTFHFLPLIHFQYISSLLKKKPHLVMLIYYVYCLLLLHTRHRFTIRLDCLYDSSYNCPFTFIFLSISSFFPAVQRTNNVMSSLFVSREFRNMCSTVE